MSDYESFVAAIEPDGWDLDNPAEAVTLAAYVVGPSIKRIARFLGRPRHWVAEPARLLRDNGVWSAGRIVVDGEDGPDVTELALQVSVADGMLERVES